MAERNARMIVHMHFKTTGARQVFLGRIQSTFEAEHLPSGMSGLNSGSLVVKAIEAGRNP